MLKSKLKPLTNEERFAILKTFAETVDDEPNGYAVHCHVNMPVSVIYKDGQPVWWRCDPSDYWHTLPPIALEHAVDKFIKTKI